MKVRSCLFALLFAVAWLVGCGSPGAPLPPSLELSRPVENLTAMRKGNKVYLSWVAPTQTTDGQNVRAKKIGPAQVCRRIAVFPMASCGQEVGQVPATQITLAKPGEQPKRITFTDSLPESVERQHSTEFATYAVAMLNWRGRSAGLSNQVKIPVAPVAAPPPEVRAEVAADGVHLSFICSAWVNDSIPLEHHYRVYRRTEGGPNAVLIKDLRADQTSAGAGASTTNSNCTPADDTFDWEKTYFYHVTPVTLVTENGKQIAQIDGDDSPEMKVFTHDVFPPAQPTGVQAVYSGPGQKSFIDLTWAPNTDADLDGYNVYRHEEGQRGAKINAKLVKTPSYRDENVQPGHAYFYSVSAVDLRANESPRSEETSERVP